MQGLTDCAGGADLQVCKSIPPHFCHSEEQRGSPAGDRAQRGISGFPVREKLYITQEWQWSSFRFYAYGEPGLVKVNELFLSHPSKIAKGGAPTTQME